MKHTQCHSIATKVFDSQAVVLRERELHTASNWHLVSPDQTAPQFSSRLPCIGCANNADTVYVHVPDVLYPLALANKRQRAVDTMHDLR